MASLDDIASALVRARSAGDQDSANALGAGLAQASTQDAVSQRVMAAYARAQRAGDAAAAHALGAQLSDGQRLAASFATPPTASIASPASQVPVTATPQSAAGVPVAAEQPFPKARGFGGTVLNQTADAVNAASQHVGAPLLGVGQLVMHGANAITGGALASPTGAFDRYIQNEDAQYQGTQPNGIGTDIGAVIGDVLPWLAGEGELRAAGMLPRVSGVGGKLGALATTGALMGASSPVTGQDYWTQKAIQTGGGAALAGALGGAGLALDPLSRILGRGVNLFSARGRDALADARTAKLLQGADAQTLGASAPFVRGETVTAAQAAPSPIALQAERTMRTNPESQLPFVNAENGNDAARVAELDDMAGGQTQFQKDAALRQAYAMRKNNFAPFAAQHLDNALPAERWGAALNALKQAGGRMSGDDFNALHAAGNIIQKVRSPASGLQEDDALDELHGLADQVTSQSAQNAFDNIFQAINAKMADPQPTLDAIARTRLTSTGRPVVIKAMNDLESAIRGAQDTRGLVPNQALHSIRTNLRGTLNAASNNGRASASDVAALSHLKSTLSDTLDRYAPGYSDALGQFARDSGPINQMEAAGAALSDLDRHGLNSAGGRRISLADVNRAIDHDDSAEFPMPGSARARLEAIRNSLQRQSISENKIGTKASDTGANNRLKRFAESPWTARLAGGAIGAGVGGQQGGGWPGYLTGGALGLGGSLAAQRLLAPMLDDVAARTGARMANAHLAAGALSRNAARAQAPLSITTPFLPFSPYLALPVGGAMQR